MRLIAERLLPDAAGTTYVDKELVSSILKPLPPPKGAHAFHAYVSAANPGAAALMDEAAQEQKMAHTTTTDVSRLAECDHMLLYLVARSRPLLCSALLSRPLLSSPHLSLSL